MRLYVSILVLSSLTITKMVDGGWLEHRGSGMRDDQRRSAGGNGSNACYLSRARDGSYVSHLLVFRDDGVMPWIGWMWMGMRACVS